MVYKRTESIRPFVHIKAHFPTLGSILDGIDHEWHLSPDDQKRVLRITLSEGDVAKVYGTYDDHLHPQTHMSLAELVHMVSHSDYLLGYQLLSLFLSQETRYRIVNAIADREARSHVQSLVSVAMTIESQSSYLL